jgi:hypothetical protein
LCSLAIHIEWLKARARKNRWTKEVDLLREEMRRVLRFLEWRAEWWESRLTKWEGLDTAVVDGLSAYALRQAALHKSISTAFMGKWDTTAVKAARDAAKEDVAVDDLFSD